MRSFFAILATDLIRQRAEQMMRELRKQPHAAPICWMALEKLHITLQFLGDITLKQAHSLLAELASTIGAMPMFSLELDRVALFPSYKHPKVIALLVKPNSPLTQLAALINCVAAERGILLEDRPFRAHLSLGRVKEKPYPDLDGIILPSPLELPVNQIVLLESQYQTGSRIYVPYGKLDLANLLPSCAEGRGA